MGKIFYEILRLQNSSQKLDIINTSNNILLRSFIKMFSSKETKLCVFFHHITNSFASIKIKSLYFQVFYKAQHAYHVLQRFVTKCKYKQCHNFGYHYDLCFNHLSEYKESMLCNVYDENTKNIHTFALPDLIKLINKSLLYQEFSKPQPKTICNPFTNLPFKPHVLYNIYFKIMDSPISTPILFQLFFKSEFDIMTFYMKNECYVRECVARYVSKNIMQNMKETYIYDMLDMYNNYHRLNIHTSFPSDILINAFEDILEQFVLTLHLPDSYNKYESERVVIKYINDFYRNNKMFGRKQYLNDTYKHKFIPNSPFNQVEQHINGKFFFYHKNFTKPNIKKNNTKSKKINLDIPNDNFTWEFNTSTVQVKNKNIDDIDKIFINDIIALDSALKSSPLINLNIN